MSEDSKYKRPPTAIERGFRLGMIFTGAALASGVFFGIIITNYVDFFPTLFSASLVSAGFLGIGATVMHRDASQSYREAKIDEPEKARNFYWALMATAYVLGISAGGLIPEFMPQP